MRHSDQNRSATFERLLRPHLDRLYRFAYRLTGSKPEAEDLFQDVLVKLFGKLDELVTIEEPGSWSSRVMYNHFIDNRRRFARQRLVSVDEGQLRPGGVDSLPGPDSPERDAERQDDISRLDKALAALSEEHRLVVLLHDSEGYKLKEIQDITGDPIGTLKSRLHRARARLRDLLSAVEPFEMAARVRGQKGS
jgi:RNA polymerase sigma-70 factor (ECF subfamily)